ncbi:MAG: PKD domain-containing protein [Oscillospiraceae bacterium]|jgi:chitinase|nr:PKD domain-containing protein [Oscillospiraceae bacterium]
MKKQLKRCLAIAIAVALLLSMQLAPSGLQASAKQNPTGVKRNIMVGYYHVFKNGAAPGLRLKDVKECWDVLELSFGEPSDGAGNVVFNPMADGVYANQQQLIDDIAIVHARGQKVCLSIGGQNGKVTLSSMAQANTFVTTVRNIINTYNLDGLDVDFEGHSIYLEGSDQSLKNPTSPTVVNLIYALKQICASYGDGFILTMAPETLLCHNGVAFYGGAGDSRNGVYLPVIDAMRSELSWLQAQLYNTANAYTPWDNGAISGPGVTFDVKLLDMMLEGFYIGQVYTPSNIGDPDKYFAPLSPDQLVLGVPSGTNAAGAGILPPSDYIQILNLMMKGGTTGGYTVKHPSKNFRGIMTWSVNWDVFNNFNFTTPIAPFIEEANQAFSLSLSVSNPATDVDTGTSIIYSATANGSNLGAVNYKFEVLSGTDVVHTQNGSGSVLNYTYNSPGTYKVRVTASNAQGTEVKESPAVTVNAKPIYVQDLSLQDGNRQVGTPLVWNCTGQGTGALQYKFTVYNGSTAVYTGSYGSAASVSYTPTVAGDYRAVAEIKDALGLTATGSSKSVWVKAPLSITSISKVASTHTVSITGGSGDISYSYYVLKNGKVLSSQAYTSSNSFTYVLPSEGVYQLRFYVQDDETRLVQTKEITVISL